MTWAELFDVAAALFCAAAAVFFGRLVGKVDPERVKDQYWCAFTAAAALLMFVICVVDLGDRIL